MIIDACQINTGDLLTECNQNSKELPDFTDFVFTTKTSPEVVRGTPVYFEHGYKNLKKREGHIFLVLEKLHSDDKHTKFFAVTPEGLGIVWLYSYELVGLIE